MGRVLSENQSLLVRYLSAMGCSKRAVFNIISNVWEYEETLQMLQFCKDNHGVATEDDFIVAAKEISAKKEKRTIEDVWNIKDRYQFLKAMDLYLSIKCDYGDEIEKLNEEEKTFFLVQVFEEYILRGSFTGFFFNYCGDFANDIAHALEKIGAVKTAEICKKAFSIYGDKVPMDRDEREDIYNLRDEKNCDFIRRCEMELSECDENILELCYQFVLSKKDSFAS